MSAIVFNDGASLPSLNQYIIYESVLINLERNIIVAMHCNYGSNCESPNVHTDWSAACMANEHKTQIITHFNYMYPTPAMNKYND